MDTPNPSKNNIEFINEHYGLEDEDISHPSCYKTIIQNLQEDIDLIKIVLIIEDFSIKIFHCPYKKCSLICRNYNILIPKQLEKHKNRVIPQCIVPSQSTETSVSQHFY